MGKIKYCLSMITGLLLFFALLVGQAPAEATSYRDRFDAADKNAVWYNGANNEKGALAWGRSYVLESYLIMYRLTGDNHYLDKFVTGADQALAARDSVRGVTDYRGLSLPAWRAAGGYTLDGKYYIFAAHTGMISYPLADFADIVYWNNLSAYKAKADTYLQAAKDAVAVHDDEWRESGGEGWYIARRGAPVTIAGSTTTWDGAGVPFNMYLALARAELAIYRASGEQLYLNRVTKMARHFKGHLRLDAADNAYIWNYWWGPAYSGWTAADNISAITKSYSGYKGIEDLNHGAIDVSFAYLAYANGIVFDEQDMQRFGSTVEKNLLRPDGKVSSRVDGKLYTSSTPSYLGMWLKYSHYAPSMFEFVKNELYKLNSYSAPALLALAELNRAAAENAGGGDRGGNPVNDAPSVPGDNDDSTPDGGSDPGSGGTPGDGGTTPGGNDPVDPGLLVNGDFSAGRTGWSGTSGTVQQENGNNYISVGYTWGLYQDVPLTPGVTYLLTGQSRLGSASTGARVVTMFIDSQGNRTADRDVKYNHQGGGWEQLPAVTGTVPASAQKIRVYLLINGGSGTHEFDNLSLTVTGGASADPPAPPADTTAPRVVEFSPADGTAIDADTTFQAVFSEPVIGVNQNTFYIENVPGTVTYDDTSRTAVLTPTAPLEEGRDYRVRLDAGIADQADNGLEPLIYSYRVPDDTNPEVTLTSPVDTSVVHGVQTLTVSASDNVGVQSVVFQYKAASGSWQTLDAGTLSNGAWTTAWDTAGLQGSFLVRAVANDAAGNQAVSAEVQVTAANRQEPAAGEVLVNGDFYDGGSGWNTSGGKVAQDVNGNKFATVGYTWQFYQDVTVQGGEKYLFKAQTMKGTGADEARVTLLFIDGQGRRTVGQESSYTHTGAGWENYPAVEATIPDGTVAMRVYILSNGSSVHYFDNVSLVKTAAAPPKPQNAVENGDFQNGLAGWNGGMLNTSGTNKFAANGYNWSFFQDVKVKPGENYIFKAQARRGTGSAPARAVLMFIDGAGNRTVYRDVALRFSGTGWEDMEQQMVTVPSGAQVLRVYLLAGDKTSTHYFDNVSLIKQ